MWYRNDTKPKGTLQKIGHQTDLTQHNRDLPIQIKLIILLTLPYSMSATPH